jgi:hypothetical protein
MEGRLGSARMMAGIALEPNRAFHMLAVDSMGMEGSSASSCMGQDDYSMGNKLWESMEMAYNTAHNYCKASSYV